MTIGLVMSGKGGAAAVTSGLAFSSGLEVSLVLNKSVKGFSEAAVKED